MLIGVPDEIQNRCPPGSPDRISSRARSAARREEAARRMSRLLGALEGEIVPRLLLSRAVPESKSVPANAEPVDAGDAAELARLLLDHEVDIPFAYVEAVMHRGASAPQIYLQLLAPAARCLGQMWENDECDFLAVTLGLGRLHQVLQRLSLRHPAPARTDTRGPARSALLVTAPGEDHSFGVLVVSQFFRQNGWDVWNECPESDDELGSLVRQRPFSVVGISAGSESLLDSLVSAVRQVRRASLNRSVAVMVGGALFSCRPELVARVGADATAADGHEALARAESVCALLAGAP